MSSTNCNKPSKSKKDGDGTNGNVTMDDLISLNDAVTITAHRLFGDEPGKVEKFIEQNKIDVWDEQSGSYAREITNEWEKIRKKSLVDNYKRNCVLESVKKTLLAIDGVIYYDCSSDLKEISSDKFIELLSRALKNKEYYEWLSFSSLFFECKLMTNNIKLNNFIISLFRGI